MVNTQLFQTSKGQLLPEANVCNAEGGPAYALGPRQQLAQLAATGCLSQTFYANAEVQLDRVVATTIRPADCPGARAGPDERDPDRLLTGALSRRVRRPKANSMLVQPESVATSGATSNKV
jgi:hypothetical protein